MRVLMFGWEFPPMISGGLGTVCKALTQHLTQLNTQVLFVMPRVVGERPEMHNFQLLGANEVKFTVSTNSIYKNLSKETLAFFEVNAMLHPYLDQMSYQQYLTEHVKDKEMLHRLQSLRQQGSIDFHGGYGKDLFAEVSRYALVGAMLGMQENFDVIHAHDWMSFTAGIEAKRTSGKPLICHVHATEFDRTGGHPNQDIYNMERFGLQMADRVFAVSQRTKDTICWHYGIDPKKVFVVHNAVSKEKLVERADIKKQFKEKIVLFLGRITIQKGPDYFVEAANKVLKRMSNVRFVMAGSGDMMNRLVERVAYYRMQKNFHFTGFLYGRDVEEMFALSDLYVMPSVSEPFGITPFEAMLYHVPVIISKQSGIAEVLKSAVKIDFWDVNKLTNSILEILTNDSLAQRLVEEGGKELDKISWETASQKINSHYHEVAGL